MGRAYFSPSPQIPPGPLPSPLTWTRAAALLLLSSVPIFSPRLFSVQVRLMLCSLILFVFLLFLETAMGS